MKKIAIIGAGFSGLGLCYHLLQEEGEKEITLFDGNGVGGGASGIASGLLHPFPGESALLSWQGKEAMAATLDLLKVVGEECYKDTGILRIAVNKKQQEVFPKRAEQEEDIEWWDAEQCRSVVPGGHYLPGIFIRTGVTVHASLYLQGLWDLCESKGVLFEKRMVSLEDLEGYDQVVLAAGAGMREFDVGIKINVNKGQILQCKKPKYWNLKSSLVGKGYIAHSSDPEKCILGSTYEREYFTEEATLGTATDLILKRIGEFIPSLGSFEVEGCKAAMRVTSQKSYHPLYGAVKPGVFVLTAMGSRGLLYHSLLGKALAKEMSAPILEEAL